MKLTFGIRDLSILSILTLCTSSIATAEQHIGNGGDIVYCAQNSVNSRTELLDYFEARTLRNTQLDVDTIVGDEWIKAKAILNRLADVDPTRNSKYLAWLATFKNESNFLAGVELVDISDSEHIAIPAGCKIVQLIIQKDPKYPGDMRYTISKDYWDQMTTTQRAGAIVHEIILREAVVESPYSGNRNSLSTRYLNGILSSGGFRSTGDYILTLTYLDYLDVPSEYTISGLQFTYNDRITSGGIPYLWPMRDSTNANLRAYLRSNTDQILKIGNSTINFSTSIQNGSCPVFDGHDRCYVESVTFDVKDWSISQLHLWSTDEKFAVFSIAAGRTANIQIAGEWYYPSEFASVNFYKNGSLKTALSGAEQDLPSSDGTIVKVAKGAVLNFDEQGYLIYK